MAENQTDRLSAKNELGSKCGPLTPSPVPPFVSINRVAYSLSSFNQQFRRISRLSDSFGHAKDNATINTGLEGYTNPTESDCCFKPLSGSCFSNKLSCTNLTQFFANLTPLTLVKQYFPCVGWLAEYNKKNLISDLIAGLTITVFHVPECMGYSFLANVNPIFCLNTALFPASIYALMGTSPFCSVGTFAALSIMIGNVVRQTQFNIRQELMIEQSEMSENETAHFLLSGHNQSSSMFSINNVENEEIAFVCAFIIGIYQLLFGLFRLGFVSVYMSEQFLNGFTCSVAYHVLCSQIQHILGLSRSQVAYRKSDFKLIRYLFWIVSNLLNANPADVAISILTACLLALSKWFIDPWLRDKKKIHVSFPVEFFLVISGVVASRYMYLNSRYQVKIIGPIQSGFPSPSVPKVATLFGRLWEPCISMAVVSYAVTYSMGRTFSDQIYERGRKTNQPSNSAYPPSSEINPSQELVALGCCNLVGSLFSCIPSGASLSRSAIQVGSGGQTQLVSFVNSLGILVVLYMSSFFETLPKTILATIICFALRHLLANVCEFRKYWKISKVDGSVWIVTFWSVILLDINWGLYVGLLYSLLTLIYKAQLPPTYLIGAVKLNDQKCSLDFFVPLNKYVGAQELPDIKIFQFCGPLHFANVHYFISQIESKLNLNIRELIKIKSILIQLEFFGEANSFQSFKTQSSGQPINQEFYLNCNEIKSYQNDDDLGVEDIDDENSRSGCMSKGKLFSSMSTVPQDEKSFKTLVSRYRSYLKRLLPRYLIIDCSMFSYIDTDGLKTLKRLINDFDYLDVKVFLGGCPSHVGRLLEKSDLGQISGNKTAQLIYISLPDAIEHARQEQRVLSRTLKSDACERPGTDSSMPTATVMTDQQNNPTIKPFPKLTESHSEPSLFSSASSTHLSIADSLIQQLTIPVVIETQSESFDLSL